MKDIIQCILISLAIYSSILYIECLLFDIKNNNNNHQSLRSILSILVSVLLGLICLIQ